MAHVDFKKSMKLINLNKSLKESCMTKFLNVFGISVNLAFIFSIFTLHSMQRVLGGILFFTWVIYSIIVMIAIIIKHRKSDEKPNIVTLLSAVSLTTLPLIFFFSTSFNLRGLLDLWPDAIRNGILDLYSALGSALIGN